MLQIFKKVDIDFIGFQRKAFLLSGVVILVGVISLVLHGGPRYGIDFTGGSLIQVHFENPVTADEIRSSLYRTGLEGSMIQRFGTTSTVFLIRTQAVLEGSGSLGNSNPLEGVEDKGNLELQETSSIGEVIMEGFSKDFPNNSFRFDREEMVGPRVSKALLGRAVWIVLGGMGVILLYVWLRFTIRFGIAAVAALFHDVLITLGLFSILDKEITIPIIAAFLTIVGYSINDSIVVSDRIRENIRLMRKEPFSKIVNNSINQTLSRTVITGVTTFIVLIILFFFGGEVIHDFSIALLVGVVVGTYSSIFVVAPIVVEWEKFSPTRAKMLR
ncbi:protein translocase subunit SecF [candidate division TA06 bacterium]|nr:protein translocase subunit SecF [candidate division TA06 bacterium]